MSDNFGLKIGLEGEKEFKKSLSEINQAFKVLGSEMKLVDSQFDKNDKSIEAVSARNEVLNKEIEAQKQKVETLRAALDNAASSFGENDRRTQSWQIQLNNAQAVLNGMERELSANEKAVDGVSDELNDADRSADKFADGIKDAGDSANKFSDEIKNAGDSAEKTGGRFEKLGKIAKGIGTALSAATAAIGAAVGVAAKGINDCVNVYADFDDSMRQVAATMGMKADEIENGSKSFELLENAAKEAGANTRFSASEAADALNYLALAGYDAEKSAETLPKVLNLAAAGGMDLAVTSDLVTDAMSALGMETSQLDGFIDQMAKTSQKSNTSVQQLGEAILVCAGTASSTGQDLTTLNTALGVLADNGIKGSEGGTHLRNILLSLSTPTDKAAGQLADLGISVFDASGNMRQLDSIITDLESALDSLTQEEKTNAISAIFNKTDISAVNALLSSTGGRFDELSGIISNCTGAAAEMAGTMESGLAGTTRSFNSAVEGMQIEIGSVFSDIKNEIMSDSTDIIRNFATALREADGDWSKIGSAVGAAVGDAIAIISKRLPEIIDLIMNVISMIGLTIMDNLPIVLKSVQSVIMLLVDGLIGALPQVMDAGVQIIVSIVTGISNAIPTLVPQIVRVIVQIVQTLIDNLPLILNAALQLITGLAQGLLDALPVLIEALPAIIQGIVDFLVSAIPQIIETGVRLLTALVGALLDIIQAVVEVIPQIIDGIITAVISAIPQLIEAGIKLLVSLVENLPKIITTIVAAVPKIISSVIDAVIGAVPQLIQAGITLFISLIENLPAIIVEIVKAVPQIITGIVDAFGSYFGKMSEVGGNLLKGLWQGISNAGAWLREKISGFFGGVVDSIKNFFGIHSPSTLFAELGDFMAKGLGIGFGDEMKDVTKDMVNAIPSEFDTDIKANINSDFSRGTSDTAAALDVTIPLTVDGVMLTKIVSRIQWSQNTVTVRNMGAVR